MKKVLFALLCLIACDAAFSQDRIEVLKKVDLELHETQYGVNSAGCPLLWTVHRSSFVSRVGIKEDQVAGCNASLDQITRIRAALLDKVIADIPDTRDLHSFYWGALPHDKENEYVRRLAVAGGNSPFWDKNSGKLFGKAAGDVHYFPKLFNERKTFAELTSLFAAHGLTIKAEDVERVLVGHLDLPADGISKSDTVPIDCDILFLISKKSK